MGFAWTSREQCFLKITDTCWREGKKTDVLG